MKKNWNKDRGGTLLGVITTHWMAVQAFVLLFSVGLVEREYLN